MAARTRSTFEQLTTGYLCLILTVFLFCFGTQGYLNMQAMKFRVYALLSGGYLLGMALLALTGLCTGACRPPSPVTLLRRSSWAQRLMLLYLLLTWLSALCSPHFPRTLLGVSRHEGALTITLYVLCFLLVSVYGRVTKPLLWLTAVGALAFAALCLLQLAGGNPLGLYPAGYNYHDAYTAYSGAYLGTIGNVDLVAAYLCLVIPLLWIPLLRLRGRQRWLLLIPLAAALAVLLQMSVLAGLVGVFGGAVLMLPVVLPLSARTRRRVVLAILLLALLVVALLWAVDLGSGLLHELHELLHGRASPSFGSGRLHIWREVLARIPDHFWLGAGPDTMLLARLEAFTRFDAASGRVFVGQIDVAHNEYLHILYHQGVFALAAYLLALGALAVRWIRRSPSDPIAAALGGAVLCYCVQAFFGFSMCMTAPFFWLTLALLDGRCRRDADFSSAPTATPDTAQ